MSVCQCALLRANSDWFGARENEVVGLELPTDIGETVKRGGAVFVPAGILTRVIESGTRRADEHFLNEQVLASTSPPA